MLRTGSILSASLLAALSIAPQARAEPPRPNIVFIMADDLGNADLGYRGGDIRTPNIDKLATEGVRLEDFYSMPACTPSRAQLMTGRYAMHYGLQTLVIFPSHTYGLATDERTLPQALKEAGYKTMMVGKWHLGHADRKYWPQNRGFEYFYGDVVGEVDYFARERGAAPIAAGKHWIVVDTSIGEPGGPADVTISVDGQQAMRVAVKRTVPGTFSASETLDVGVDLGSPVSFDYFDQAPFAFTGQIGTVTVDLL